MNQLPIMVITGTSKGIGRGLAEYFVNHGYLVAGCSRGSTTFLNDAYCHDEVDIGDSAQVRAWIRSIKRKFGRIDVLICNAGIAPANLLLTMTSDEVLDNVFHANIKGTFQVCREVSKVMMMQRSGRIITLSSMAVGLHEEGTAAYSASKSGIVEMTKILAKELAPMGITCNVLAPSMVMTDLVEVLGESIIARALEKLTIKRVLSIREVANVVEFFSAPESSCVTGQVVHMGLVV
ncbi:SDR family NAD(P)-dependent oxidoreductase [Pelosinus sp. sgz500959]|uniref:SDR family NAD(P)-dependent oxidoreductase n=1 Tax=Pelosinus sp. sgz500959 TaxID=3242472 RepID=UPI00366C0E65